MLCKHYPEMKLPKMKHPCMQIFYTTKMVENMVITCLFEKTAEKTTSGIMSCSEENARQPKKQGLGIR